MSSKPTLNTERSQQSLHLSGAPRWTRTQWGELVKHYFRPRPANKYGLPGHELPPRVVARRRAANRAARAARRTGR